MLKKLKSNPKLILTVAIFVLIAGYAGVRISLGAPTDPAVPTGPTAQILVRYKTGTDIAALRSKFSQVGALERDEIKNIRVKVLKVPEGARDKILRQLEADPRVEFAEADAIVYNDVTVPNDTRYAEQWSWPNTKTDLLWDKTKGSSNVVIAVVDTGINFSHPEFAGKLVPGYDFVNLDNDPTDDAGHGSWVSGVIGAKTNNAAGIASGCWECKIMPIKTSKPVPEGGSAGRVSDIAKGVQYAADNGAKIINSSSSDSIPSSVMDTAIEYAKTKGAVVVVSAGNTGKNELRYPAANPNVISVTGTDRNDVIIPLTVNPTTNKESGATHGTHIDIAAPWTATTPAHNSTGYVTVSGTSFSTPTVASVLGLLLSAFPNATRTDLIDAVTKNTDPCCTGKVAPGGGRLNADKAYAFLAAKFGTPNPPNPPPPNPPPPPPPGGKKGDVSGPTPGTPDGKTDLRDLSYLLINWGENKTPAQGDISGSTPGTPDGKVDLRDLSYLLINWG